MQPFFSIIIPTYNSSATLKACIDSILNQSFSDYEIVVIDNESQDETINILNAYSDKRIKIHIGKDKGIYDAMNKGVSLASGDWLYFIGSDDVLYNKFVLKEIHQKCRYTKCKMVYGNAEFVANSKEWQGKLEKKYDGYFDLEKLMDKNICHQAIFYNKSLFLKMGNFNPEYIVCSDYDFNLRCFASYRAEYIDIMVAKFTVGNSSTILKDVKFNEDKWKNICQYYKYQLYKKDFIPYRGVIKSLNRKDTIIKAQLLYQKMLRKIRKFR